MGFPCFKKVERIQPSDSPRMDQNSLPSRDYRVRTIVKAVMSWGEEDQDMLTDIAGDEYMRRNVLRELQKYEGPVG